MRLPSPLRPWRLESLALLAAYSTVVVAQGNGNNNNNNNDDEEEEEDPSPTSEDNSPTRENSTPRPTSDSNDDEEEEEETTSEESETPTRTSSTRQRQETQSTTSTTEESSNVPTITLGQTSDDSPLPTLSGGLLDYSYPPPAVPPTINAPFMDRSTMPNGTVFIAVGAILGTFGLAILVWRGVVACLLHRSVARAARAQHRANEKSTHRGPPATFSKSSQRNRTPPPARGKRRTTRGPVPSTTPSHSNLFFSPTAAGSAAAGANRDSRYLPSGFYAAGSAPSPGMGSHSAAGYTTLRPDSRGGQGFARGSMMDHSPDGSPQYAARQQDPSMSSLNLSQAPGQRAPSAYLDDLLDENPQMFPPQMPSQGGRHHRSRSYSSQGRR